MRFSRRELISSAAVSPLLGQKKKQAADTRHPNILLILCDDLAAWMLGCYGNREIRTPNIDLLARYTATHPEAGRLPGGLDSFEATEWFLRPRDA